MDSLLGKFVRAVSLVGRNWDGAFLSQGTISYPKACVAMDTQSLSRAAFTLQHEATIWTKSRPKTLNLRVSFLVWDSCVWQKALTLLKLGQKSYRGVKSSGTTITKG